MCVTHRMPVLAWRCVGLPVLHCQAARKREQEERALAEERAREKSQRSYKLLQVDEKKESNKDVGLNVDEYEDDFM